MISEIADGTVLTQPTSGALASPGTGTRPPENSAAQDIRRWETACGTVGLCGGLTVAAVCCCVGDKVAALFSLAVGCVATTVIGDPPDRRRLTTVSRPSAEPTAQGTQEPDPESTSPFHELSEPVVIVVRDAGVH
jgi:hypothetical protein